MKGSNIIGKHENYMSVLENLKTAFYGPFEFDIARQEGHIVQQCLLYHAYTAVHNY